MMFPIFPSMNDDQRPIFQHITKKILVQIQTSFENKQNEKTGLSFCPSVGGKADNSDLSISISLQF